MTDNFVGLTNGNALAQGGQNLGASGQALHSRLTALVEAMSRDADVIQGNGLAEFRRARSELYQRFDELTRWCSSHGVRLEDAQTAVNSTDSAAGDRMSGARAGLSGLGLAVNR